MLRRGTISAALGCMLAVAAGCANVLQPFANVQPDEGLFRRAMQLIEIDRQQEARTLLETLVATYPDSSYVPQANLALDDLWYAEDGAGSRQDADFSAGEKVTFFPPLAEEKR